MPKNPPISSHLLAHVKPEDKKRFLQDYQEANFVLDVIQKAVEKELQNTIEDEEDPKLFTEPGFAEHYAWLMGNRRMARTILKLFPKRG